VLRERKHVEQDESRNEGSLGLCPDFGDFEWGYLLLGRAGCGDFRNRRQDRQEHPNAKRVDLLSDPAWAILLKEHRDLEAVDLVRFTFELDEAVEEIHTLASAVFGSKVGQG